MAASSLLTAASRRSFGWALRCCWAHQRRLLSAPPEQAGSWRSSSSSSSRKPIRGGDALPPQSEGMGDGADGRGGGPEILFEDILPDQPFSWQDEGTPKAAGDAQEPQEDWEDAVLAGVYSRKKPQQKKAAPLADEALLEVDLSKLQRDELIWAVGRAATLRLGKETRIWRDLPSAIAAQGGEAELSPSDVCRLLQALAYAPSEAPLDKALLRRLLKAFALRPREYSDERLMRVVYAYGKLAAKRGVRMPRFIDFATSEVVERDLTLKGWRKVRILEAIGSLPEAGPEFRSILVGQVVKNMKELDAECLGRFVPMLVEAKFHERPGVVNALNGVYKRKLKHVNFDDPDLILHSGLPLLLYDLMKTSLLTKWLERLQQLQLPLTTGAMPRKPFTEASEAAPLEGASPETVEQDPMAGLSDMPWAASEFPGPSAKAPQARQKSLLPADALRAAKNLEALKLAELCLRHERPSTLQSLSPRASRLLATARQMSLEPPEDLQLPELPHVFGELGRLFRASGVLLHPTVYGPYLLELSDPLGRVVVEWDTNWSLYPPWRRVRHEQYVKRKHKHLKAEGWKVHCVPQAEFAALTGKEAKISFLLDFVSKHRLEYLRLEAASRKDPVVVVVVIVAVVSCCCYS
ncbi:unnamed protein product [Polarella glacialis]|uniref:RAP domain-containing protein n=1 Tax=Polarella glacialis TaxID=89957 RepID=A0A813JY30_POLGL|nr:unnamed protein product [Polarella glacialis]